MLRVKAFYRLFYRLLLHNRLINYINLYWVILYVGTLQTAKKIKLTFIIFRTN